MAQGLGENLAINIGVNVTGLPQVQQVQTRMNNLNKTIQKSTSQYNANAVAANKWAKGALQQAGYQVGDFAVQIANGTSAVQAFGQQGSQLLGIFGPIGAVLGAVVAIGSAVGVAFARAGIQGKSLQDIIDELSNALSSYQDAARDANQSSDELNKKYGEAAEGARELFQAQANLRRLDAIDILGKTVVALRDEFGSFADVTREEIQRAEDAFKRLGDTMAKPSLLSDQDLRLAIDAMALFDKKVMDLRDTMGATNEQAFALAKELADLGAAEGPAQISKELEDVRSTFLAIVGSIDTATEEQRELYRQLIESAIAALDLDVNLGDAADSAEDAKTSVAQLSIETNGAADAAIRLRDALASAATAAMTQQEKIAILTAKVAAAQRGGSAAYAEAAATTAIELGKAGASLDQIATAANTAGQQAVKIEQLNEQFRELGQTGGGAMSKIKESTDNALGSLDKMFTELDATVGNISKTIEDSLTSGFMAMVDGTKTAKDAFRDMAKAIIAELYKVLVVQQLVGSVEKGTGLAGAIGSALGFSGVRASGGQVTANKAYLVGERGPEMLVPSRNAHVIPNSKMGGGGGPVQVVYQFQGGVTEADLGRALPLLVERTKREVVDAVQRGGSVARVFR